jgi:adenylate cyclase, class 2
MGQETEIKLRIEDVREFLAKLKVLGARAVPGPVAGRTGRLFESNLLFDTVEEDLRKRGQLLRIRTESSPAPAVRSRAKRSGPKAERVLITFKRPVNGTSEWKEEEAEQSLHKVREEIELEVSDAASLAKIFEGLGMRNWFRYEKFRTTFRLPESQRWAEGLLIELDETPIGTFVELEGPAKAIDETAKRLGFTEQDYIVANYFSLYRADCDRRGEKPGHMVFRRRK